MSELLAGVASWPTFLAALLIFGLAPGIFLRAVVLMYPRDDPIRRELLAELRAVPRWERPLWVAEQLETAIFEGLVHKIGEAIAYRRGYMVGVREVKTIVLQQMEGETFLETAQGVVVHVPSMARCKTPSVWRSWHRILAGYMRLTWRVVRAKRSEGDDQTA